MGDYLYRFVDNPTDLLAGVDALVQVFPRHCPPFRFRHGHSAKLGFNTNIKLVGDIADVPRALPHLVLPDLTFISKLIVPAIAIGIIGLVQVSARPTPTQTENFRMSPGIFLVKGQPIWQPVFFGGIPAGGSNSSTALMVSAGARSRWANIFGGISVAIVVFLFANLVELVAMPALAGLVIIAGVQMVKLNAIQTVWQTNTVSRTIMSVTFGSTLIMPLQYAVLVGVVISISMFVLQQSNALRIVEWDVQDLADWPVERPAPTRLKSGRATVLYIYGNLFYAAADTFEKNLPAAEGTHRSVVILLLRGYEDIGSTVIGALHRYTKSLQANGGKLILAGVSPALLDQLKRTRMLSLIGEENIFHATDTIGESGNIALRAARIWLSESWAEADKRER